MTTTRADVFSVWAWSLVGSVDECFIHERVFACSAPHACMWKVQMVQRDPAQLAASQKRCMRLNTRVTGSIRDRMQQFASL